MRNDDKKKYVELGKLLYKYRKQKGYSLRRAAELAGCSNPTIMRAEKGTGAMTQSIFLKYCDVLGVDANKLLSEASMNAIFADADAFIEQMRKEYDLFVPNEEEVDLILKIRELPKNEQDKIYSLVEQIYNDYFQEDYDAENIKSEEEAGIR